MWTLDVGQWSLGGRERQLPRGEPEVGESHDHRRRRLLACLVRIVCVFELALSMVGAGARALTCFFRGRGGGGRPEITTPDHDQGRRAERSRVRGGGAEDN